MEIAPQVEQYSHEWFTKRAFDSLKKIDEKTWDFSDSLLLYTPGTETEYEDIQKIDTPYHEMVTKPERAYLEHIAPQLAQQLPQEFEYIDLGPGSEHKEQFFLMPPKH